MKKLNEKNNENYDFELKQKVVEALIFSSSNPVPYDELLKRLSDKNILNEILENLEKKYSSSGVNLFIINDAVTVISCVGAIGTALVVAVSVRAAR